MEKFYMIMLTEQKCFPVDTFYKYEINDILHDSKDFREATIFDSFEFCDDLKQDLENKYDYTVTVLEYVLTQTK